MQMRSYHLINQQVITICHLHNINRVIIAKMFVVWIFLHCILQSKWQFCIITFLWLLLNNCILQYIILCMISIKVSHKFVFIACIVVSDTFIRWIIIGIDITSFIEIITLLFELQRCSLLAGNSFLLVVGKFMVWRLGFFWKELMGWGWRPYHFTLQCKQPLSYCTLPKWKCSFHDCSQHMHIPTCPQQLLSTIAQLFLPWLHRQYFCIAQTVLPRSLYAIMPHCFCNHLAAVFVVDWLLFIDKHAQLYMLQPHLKLLDKKVC